MNESSTERLHADFQRSLSNLVAALASPDQPPAEAPPANSPAGDKHLA
jgi:hypothetical protein